MFFSGVMRGRSRAEVVGGECKRSGKTEKKIVLDSPSPSYGAIYALAEKEPSPWSDFVVASRISLFPFWSISG